MSRPSTPIIATVFGLFAGAIVGFVAFGIPFFFPNREVQAVLTGILAFGAAGAALGYGATLLQRGSIVPPASTDESSSARTNKLIAFVLLGVFSASLFLVFLSAQFGEDPETKKSWVELFKSGFTLLTGTVTTVIGYYFGSKGTEQAQQQAKTATDAIVTLTEKKQQPKQPDEDIPDEGGLDMDITTDEGLDDAGLGNPDPIPPVPDPTDDQGAGASTGGGNNSGGSGSGTGAGPNPQGGETDSGTTPP